MLPSTSVTRGSRSAPREVGARAAHEVVEDDDLAHRLGEQLIDDVRADEPGAANHRRFVCLVSPLVRLPMT